MHCWYFWIEVSSSYSSKGLSRALASWSVEGMSDRCRRNGRPWMQVWLLPASCWCIRRRVSSTSSLDRFVGNWRASRTASPCEVKETNIYIYIYISISDTLEQKRHPLLSLIQSVSHLQVVFDFKRPALLQRPGLPVKNCCQDLPKVLHAEERHAVCHCCHFQMSLGRREAWPKQAENKDKYTPDATTIFRKE